MCLIIAGSISFVKSHISFYRGKDFPGHPFIEPGNGYRIVAGYVSLHIPWHTGT